jgi:hypothetical protein
MSDHTPSTAPTTVPVTTNRPDPSPPDNLPSHRTRGSKPRQIQLNLHDIEAEISTSGPPIVAQQAALLPPVNISNRTHTTRARSTRARPPTDSPTAMDIGDEPGAPSVIKPPPKKRKTNNNLTNTASGPSKPPKITNKGKEKAAVPNTESPPSSSPIQKLASAIRDRLPGLFSDTTRKRHATADLPRDHASPQDPQPPVAVPQAIPQLSPVHRTRPMIQPARPTPIPETNLTDETDPLVTIKKSALEELISKIVRQQQRSDGAGLDKRAHRAKRDAINVSDDDDYPGDFRFSGSTPSSPGTFYYQLNST